MTAIEKAKVAISHALIDMDTIDRITDSAGLHRFALLRHELTEALAASEAKNPASEDMDITDEIALDEYATSLIDEIRCQEGDLEGVDFMITEEEVRGKIFSFAKAYHAKRCASCAGNGNRPYFDVDEFYVDNPEPEIGHYCPHCGAHPVMYEAWPVDNQQHSSYRAVCSVCKKPAVNINE